MSTDATAAPEETVEIEEVLDELDLPDEPDAESEPDAPADDEGAAPPAESSETAEPADGPPASETVPDALTTAEVSEPEPERPFSFRADHTDIAVDGAVVQGDRITIPVDVWQNRIRPHLVADRMALQRQSYETGHREALKTVEQHPTVKYAEELVKAMDGVLELPEDRLLEWIQDKQRNADLLRLRAQNQALLARDQDGQRRQTEQDRLRQQQELEPQIRAGLRQNIDQILADPEFAGKVPAVYAEKLHEKLLPFAGQLVFQAPRDMPEYGLRRGEYGVRLDLIRQQAMTDLALIDTVRPKPVSTAQQKAAAANAKATAPAKPAPPTVSAKGSPAPSAEPDAKQFKDGQEFDEYLRSKYPRVPMR